MSYRHSSSRSRPQSPSPAQTGRPPFRRSRWTASPGGHGTAPLQPKLHPPLAGPQAGPGLPRSHANTPLSHPPPASPKKALLAGGSMAFLAAIAILPTQLQSRPSQPQLPISAATCQTVVQKEARLSREQLSRFLALPQQASKAAVQAVIQAPYCQLGNADTATVREVYPLAFDPDTWFVVHYTNEVYSRYEFTFRR